jgi:hypothetical protein
MKKKVKEWVPSNQNFSSIEIEGMNNDYIFIEDEHVRHFESHW